MTLRPAVFLDRDGTLVDDPGYLSDPGLVKLLPGTGPALVRLAGAGYARVVVTNQSGIGRGLFTEEDFQEVTARLAALLDETGAGLEATYHCPHAPRADPTTWGSTRHGAGGSATG